MPDADDLVMLIHLAMAQKERELISERTRAALAAAKARGTVLGGDRGYRPSAAPCAAAAARSRVEEAERTAHRLWLEIERLRRDGVSTMIGLARALTDRGVPTPRERRVWTHTTVARLVARVSTESRGSDTKTVAHTARSATSPDYAVVSATGHGGAAELSNDGEKSSSNDV